LMIMMESQEEQPLNVQITDAAGKVVHTSRISIGDGMNPSVINTSDYAAGVYFLTVSDENSIYNERFIKQ
jgi:hypothetical protein